MKIHRIRHMFRFHIITLFPDLFKSYCSTSIIGRGCSSGAVKIELFNPRDFCTDKYRRVDDTPYGGGAGMVMKPEPVFAAFEAIQRLSSSPVIITSPRGQTLTQKLAHELAQTQENELTIICGHYEGMDERISTLATHQISLGDFVLTGGELRFGQIGHPDYFSQSVSGFPIVAVADDKLQLHLTR